MPRCLALCAALPFIITIAAGAQPATHSATIWADNFDTDTSADYGVLLSSSTGATDASADFSYDHSGFIGSDPASTTIPPSPGSGGTTRGLRLDVNKFDQIPNQAAVNVFPNGVSVPAGTDHRLSFDVFIMYNGGPGGGTGSTENPLAGLFHSGALPAWQSSGQTQSDGVFVTMTGDGDVNRDYRIFYGNANGDPIDLGATNPFTAGFIDGQDNNSDFLFQTLFPSPPFETLGSPGKQWVHLELESLGSNVIWRLNGTEILINSNTSGFNSGTPMVGYMDNFDSLATPFSDNFCVIDNLRVEALNLPGPAPILVDLNASGTSDGLTWETAFPTITQGLAAAAATPEVQVWVADGIYSETVNVPSSVEIYGGFSGFGAEEEFVLEQRDIASNPVILTGGVTMNATAAARLDGFFIQSNVAAGGGGINALNAANTTTVANCVITGNSASAIGGGGILLDDSSPLITDCTIAGNTAFGFPGGGMLLLGSSAPLVQRSRISGNFSTVGGGVSADPGTAPQFVNCILSGNAANEGGALRCVGASAEVVNCTVSSNTAGEGSAIHASAGAGPTITNVIFERNSGAAVHEEDATSDPALNFCLFDSNTQRYRDEGTTIIASAPAINALINHTGSANSGNFDGDALFEMDGPAGQTGTWTSFATFANGTSTIDTAGLTPGSLRGRLINIDVTLRFEALVLANTAATVTVAGDVRSVIVPGDTFRVVDLHLQGGSDAIDEGTSLGTTPEDFESNRRPIDIVGVANDLPSNFVHDVGAFERQSAADLSLTKTDDIDPILTRNPITYTLTVTNSGPDDASAVVLRDRLPNGVTLDAVSVSAEVNGSLVTVNLGTITAGGSASVEVQVTPTVAFSTTLTNSASVEANQSDLNPDNNVATQTTSVIARADLSITKTDGLATAVPGESISYTIVVSNAGPIEVFAAEVTDFFSPDFENISWTASPASGAIVLNASGVDQINEIVGLPVDGSITYTVDATIASSAFDTITNTAEITAPFGVDDPNTANNTASESTPLVAEVDLKVTKTDSADPAAAGSPLAYTVTLENGGPSDAAGVSVTDLLPAGLDFVSSTATHGSYNNATGVWSGFDLVSSTGFFTELIINGGFENGDFTGWTTIDGGLDFFPWTVGEDFFGFFFAPPFRGAFHAGVGLENLEGTTNELFQEIAIPANAQAVHLFWSDRIQAFMFSATVSTEYVVSIQSSGGDQELARMFTYVVSPEFGFSDTGYQTHSVDLLSLLPNIRGTTVRLSFRGFIPETFTGPIQVSVDSVSLRIQEPSTATLMIQTNVRLDAPATLSNTASAEATGTELNPADNFDTEETQVTQAPLSERIIAVLLGQIATFPEADHNDDGVVDAADVVDAINEGL